MRVEPASAPPRTYAWYQKLGAVLFVMFCFEIGIFLLVFPWLEAWDSNGFRTSLPWFRDHWTNSYFRGALSGIGLLNLYISFLEIVRLRRFSASR